MTSDDASRSTLFQLVQDPFVPIDDADGPAIRQVLSPAPALTTVYPRSGNDAAGRAGDVPRGRTSLDDDPAWVDLQFGTDLRPILLDALASADAATELLAAASAQARALAAVCEAHDRGVVVLPDDIRDAVLAARQCWPAMFRPPVWQRPLT